MRGSNPKRSCIRHFPDVPDAIDRAGEIAERCRYRIPIGERTVAPRLADSADSFARLRALRLRRRGTALWRHHRADHPRPAGARARHHRTEALRRLLPRGQGHHRERADALRPRLGRQFDRLLLARHHPRRSAGGRAPLRALPQSGAEGSARHRSRFSLGRARSRARVRLPALSPSPRGDGGQSQLFPAPRRAAGSGQGARPSRGRNPRGHPAHPLVLRGPDPGDGAGRRTPTTPSSTCRPSGRSWRARRSRWWACRATCRCIPAAWWWCPTRCTTSSRRSPRPRRSTDFPGSRFPRCSSRRTAPRTPGSSRSISSATARSRSSATASRW